jgi:4'-phosphopantetheinyl transferase
MNFSSDLSRLQYSTEHKPFLPAGPHFNISHSAGRVVCLLSEERRVGIDIEYIADDIALEAFQWQFTADEWLAISDAHNSKEQFYHFWTAKESVIKADGRGLAIPLGKVDVSQSRSVILDGRAWRYAAITFFEGYSCHFCTEDFPGFLITAGTAGSDIAGLELYNITATDFLTEGFSL